MKQTDIDKWIELGVLRERQRIIKLLKEQKAIQCKKADCGLYTDDHDYDCVSEQIDCYIALIKGKTNES